ncbi:XisI protein [Leptolyngbya valderiana BDU 20041]|nr:XisI protein [Leptolyngbya valderiana BDU 20041]
MDRTLSYADILKQTVQAAVVDQPRLQAIKLYPVCDTESGHFLVLATGWDKQRWMDTILFHARLVGQQVFIEEDNFEESLTEILIANGVEQADIVTSLDRPHQSKPQATIANGTPQMRPR